MRSNYIVGGLYKLIKECLELCLSRNNDKYRLEMKLKLLQSWKMPQERHGMSSSPLIWVVYGIWVVKNGFCLGIFAKNEAKKKWERVASHSRSRTTFLSAVSCLIRQHSHVFITMTPWDGMLDWWHLTWSWTWFLELHAKLSEFKKIWRKMGEHGWTRACGACSPTACRNLH